MPSPRGSGISPCSLDGPRSYVAHAPHSRSSVVLGRTGLGVRNIVEVGTANTPSSGVGEKGSEDLNEVLYVSVAQKLPEIWLQIRKKSFGKKPYFVTK